METEATLDAADNHAIAGRDDDSLLVQAARDGHLTAFEQLVRRYDRIALAVVQSILENLEAAQDVTLQAFLKAHGGLHQFPEGTKFSIWLMRIVVHESLCRLSSPVVSRDQSLDSYCASQVAAQPLQLVDWVPGAEKLYDQPELREILERSLSSVSPTSRVVFMLRDIAGFSLRETADILDLSRTTVEVRLLQARLQLREELTSYFKQPAEHQDGGISASVPMQLSSLMVSSDSDDDEGVGRQIARCLEDSRHSYDYRAYGSGGTLFGAIMVLTGTVHGG